MSAFEAISKQLKIKTAVLNRLEKEYTSYLAEIANDTLKVEAMHQQNKCIHDINKMVNRA